MKNNETKRSRIFARMFVLVITLCMLFANVIPTNVAAAANQAVEKAKDGVVQIQVWFNDLETASEEALHYGTGFLVNDSTVVTCQHVVTGFPDEFYVEWGKETGRSAEKVKECLELRVMLYRGTYVKAKLTNANAELDLAILTLNQKIARTPLAIRSSDVLKQTESTFAIGFPADLLELDDKHTYDIDDIVITSGNVNKVGDMTFETAEGHLYDSVNCVENSARISGGNSGGPLVDAFGNVVGVNAAGSDTRFVAVSSKELMTYLTALNVEFKSGSDINNNNNNNSGNPSAPTDAPVTEPGTNNSNIDTSALSSAIAKAEKLKEKDYTADSYADLEKALQEANEALKSNDQSKIDSAVGSLKDATDALEKADGEENNDKTFLILIIAGVAVFILIIIIILVVALKKKNVPQQRVQYTAPVAPPVQQRPTPVPQPRPQPAPTYTPPVQPVSSETTILSQGAGETTVLSGGGETTVLSQQVNGGSLLRSNNNERIPIVRAEFTVGRERTKVDYCIGGNGNISRIHARFVVRDGVTYIVDNNAANGTFVNGVKLRAGQEVRLNSGDKILLADEKFEFNK